jgi:type II secretion system protein G
MMKLTNLGSKKGFTLIELLVVIAIIGILSSVVLASLSTARAKSRDARRIADIDQVRTALEIYNDSFGAYPGNGSGSAGLQSFVAGVTTGVGAISPTFMSRLPGDPTTGAFYYYCPQIARTDTTCNATNASASSTFYILAANLERTDNAALKTDTDVTAVTGFFGGSASCAATGGTEQCFDVTP